MRYYFLSSFLFLTSIFVVAQNSKIEIDGIYYNIRDIDGKRTASVSQNPMGYSGDINIPEQIIYNDNLYAVSSIESYAFNKAQDMTSIRIPKSVVKIERFSFCDCCNLNSLVVEEGNPIFDSRNNCNAIIETSTNKLIVGCRKSIIIDNIVEIDSLAFLRCNDLLEVRIPKSVKKISAQAFYYFNGILSIIVDEGNTTYDSRGNCNAIIETSSNKIVLGCNNTILPKEVTTIGANSFNYCDAITSIKLHEGVTSIEDYAFIGCSNITNVSLPLSLKTIDEGAFSLCSNIKDIYCYAKEIPLAHTSIFDSSTFNTANMYVEEDCIQLYKSTFPWSKFVHILSLSNTGINKLKGENVEALGFFSIDGKQHNKMQRGLNIIKTDKGYEKYYHKGRQ